MKVAPAKRAGVDRGAVPRLMEEEKPHLVLRGSDGIELMNDIRKTTDVPVIFYWSTARTSPRACSSPRIEAQ